MESFTAQIKNKLGEIQGSEEHVKRRWAIGISAIIMTLVVLLWVGYMRITISATANSDLPETQPVVLEAAPSQSALQGARTWATAIVQNTQSGLSSFFSRLMTPKNIEIKSDKL